MQGGAKAVILPVMGVLPNTTNSAPARPGIFWGRLICAVVCVYLLYFAGLGACPLIDPDEPVYAQVAREMASGGGWLTPHYGGRMWFDKPPLFYWISAASVKALGAGEFACRAPSALLTIGLLLLVYALVRRDFSRRAAALSTLVMATCLQTIVLAHAAVTDMTLTFCLMGSLYAYRRWLEVSQRPHDACRFGWAAACGAFAGLGMLTKGPVAPVLLGATFVIHLWWTRRIGYLISAEAVLGAASLALVGFPWFVAMYVLHRAAFVQGFLVANNLTRFIKAEHAAQTGRWYSYFLNIGVLFAFFFPWSIFLPKAICRSWRMNDGSKLAGVWLAVVFVFFSISKTQLVTYIFPLYPAAALFVGVWFDSASPGFNVRRTLWFGAAASVLIAVAVAATVRLRFPGGEAAALVLGLILVALMAAAIIVTPRRGSGKRKAERPEPSPATGDFSKAAWVIGAGMTVFTTWLVFGVMPLVGTHGEYEGTCFANSARSRRKSGRI